MKEKTFENFLDKKSNLSKSSLWLLRYGNKLINEYVDLESKIKQVKPLEDPDEEMEELLQDWVNHIVKHPPKKKKLSPQAIKQYANAVNEYLIFISLFLLFVCVNSIYFRKNKVIYPIQDLIIKPLYDG